MSKKIKSKKAFWSSFLSTAKKYLTANLINIVLAIVGIWFANASYKLTKNDKSQETQINQLGQITNSQYAQIDTLSEILSSQNFQITKLNELIASQHSQVDTLVKIAKSIDSQNLLTINQNRLIQNQISLANEQNFAIGQQNKSILGISTKISSQLKLSERVDTKNQYDSTINHTHDVVEFVNDTETLFDSLSYFIDFEVKERWLDSSKFNLAQFDYRINEVISNLSTMIKKIFKNPISLISLQEEGSNQKWYNLFDKIRDLNRDYIWESNKLSSYSEAKIKLDKIIDFKKNFEDALISTPLE
jgi:hypothetical protein